MKRLIIVASLAIAAIGCQKTEVQNEVLTPIGFNTEIGKQTRGIVDEATLPANSTFGVYAFLIDANNSQTSSLMDDVEVSAQGATTGTYYWPNDPDNTIDFYAYYPKSVAAAMTLQNKGTLGITDFDNSEYYWGTSAVDFMVATPVIGAQYGNPDGDDETDTEEGKEGNVPVVFHHELTQVKFVVNVPSTADVTYTLKSIKLNGVTTVASYSNRLSNPYLAGAWEGDPSQDAVVAYPLTTDEEDFPAGTKTTTAMLMIPKTASSFDIEYTVTSNSVTETVKHTNQSLGDIEWAANQSIKYTLNIAGPQIISFTPSVAPWDNETGDTIGVQ